MSKRKIQQDLTAFFGPKRKADEDDVDKQQSDSEKPQFIFDFESEQVTANEFNWALTFNIDFHPAVSSHRIDSPSHEAASSKLQVHIQGTHRCDSSENTKYEVDVSVRVGENGRF